MIVIYLYQYFLFFLSVTFVIVNCQIFNCNLNFSNKINLKKKQISKIFNVQNSNTLFMSEAPFVGSRGF